jgi:hypothetical protein
MYFLGCHECYVPYPSHNLRPNYPENIGWLIHVIKVTIIYFSAPYYLEARGSVVGWGTMLQAGRSRFRFPMRSLDFSSWPYPSSRIMTLWSTQLLTEMSTRNHPGG